MMNAERQFSSLILLLAIIAGCGPGNPLGRQAVSGNVTLDGAALDQGTISFSPESGADICSGTVIKDGGYSIPAVRGLPPGKYLVQINSAAPNPADKGRAANVPPGSSGLPGIERVAPAYNMQSHIAIEVVAGRTAEFNFDAKSK